LERLKLLLKTELIGYLIISKTEAVIHDCGLIKTLLPRNCLGFGGSRLHVAHFNTRALPKSVNLIFIPDSVRSIFGSGDVDLFQLMVLVFEVGSELSSISPSAFRNVSSISIFIRFIGSNACWSRDSVA
jgi:hypothetical protein